MGGGERLKTALISNKAAGFPPPKGKFDPLGQGGVGIIHQLFFHNF